MALPGVDRFGATAHRVRCCVRAGVFAVGFVDRFSSGYRNRYGLHFNEEARTC